MLDRFRAWRRLRRRIRRLRRARRFGALTFFTVTLIITLGLSIAAGNECIQADRARELERVPAQPDSAATLASSAG